MEAIMPEETLPFAARANAILAAVKAEEWIYLAIMLLLMIGVGITDYAPASSWLYWVFMVAALGMAAIVVEKLNTHAKGIPFLKLLAVQLLHWGATLAAVLVSLSLVHTGRLTYEGSGLVVLLLLALATFLDGFHVGWRFYLAGIVLGIATLAAAYFETYLWVILLVAVFSIVFAIYLEKHLSSRELRSDAAETSD
jgi:MFS family permease